MNVGINDIVAFIPVRGGSKSIPLKNIKCINGKPLLYWSIDAAIGCKYINKVFVCTDSDEIKEKVLAYKNINSNDSNIAKLECIGRSVLSATDTASTELILLEFMENYSFKQVVLIQVTNPLLKEEDLNKALDIYFENKYDSLLSVVSQKRFLWKQVSDGEKCVIEPLNYDPLNRPRRQEFAGFLVENGSFYITSRNMLEKTKCRISGDIGYYEMDDDSYFEIDELSDWIIIEEILKRNNNDNKSIWPYNKLKKVKMLITDCDGVLTDGGMYYSENGEELKKFNTRDGMGVELLKQRGIIVAIITGESGNLIKKRAGKLKIADIFMGVKKKTETLKLLMEKYNLDYSEIAYIGDDINDMEIIKKVGFSCSPKDGVDCVKEIVDYVASCRGGEGVLREVADMIISSPL